MEGNLLHGKQLSVLVTLKNLEQRHRAGWRSQAFEAAAKSGKTGPSGGAHDSHWAE